MTEEDTGQTGRDAWSRVWGDTVAAVGSDDPAYPAVARWWTAELSALAPFGALLEIGAGAAATVARIAAALFPAADIVASDFRPAPPIIPGVVFVADAPIEALPFGDGQFDVVASQFAFEYAGEAAAVGELARVLRPGGAARLLVHCPGSAFARYLPHRAAALSAGGALAGLLGERGALQGLRKVRLKQMIKRIEGLKAQYVQTGAFADIVADLQDFEGIGRRRLAGVPNPLAEADAAVLRACKAGLAVTQAQVAATRLEAEMDALMDRFRAAGFAEASYGPLAGADAAAPLSWAVRLKKGG